jgi:hypothetical protein
VFLPMGLGMFLVFFPQAARGWCRFLPVAGQQLQLEFLMRGVEAPWFQPIVLGSLTAILALIVVMAVANRLQRDEIIYGS